MFPSIVSFWKSPQGPRITVWQLGEGGYSYRLEMAGGSSKVVDKSYDEVKLALQQRGYTEEGAAPEAGTEKVEETEFDDPNYDENESRTQWSSPPRKFRFTVDYYTTKVDGLQRSTIIAPSQKSALDFCSGKGYDVISFVPLGEVNDIPGYVRQPQKLMCNHCKNWKSGSSRVCPVCNNTGYEPTPKATEVKEGTPRSTQLATGKELFSQKVPEITEKIGARLESMGFKPELDACWNYGRQKNAFIGHAAPKEIAALLKEFGFARDKKQYKGHVNFTGPNGDELAQVSIVGGKIAISLPHIWTDDESSMVADSVEDDITNLKAGIKDETPRMHPDDKSPEDQYVRHAKKMADYKAKLRTLATKKVKEDDVAPIEEEGMIDEVKPSKKIAKFAINDYIAYNHPNGRRHAGTITGVLPDGRFKVTTTWGDGKKTSLIRYPDTFVKLPKFADLRETAIDRNAVYGVRYKVFAGKEGRLATKEKWFKSSVSREAFCNKLEQTGNFYEFDGFSDPQELARQNGE